MKNNTFKKLISSIVTLCMVVCMLFSGTISTFAVTTEIDNYLSGLSVSKKSLTLNGATSFKNLINGKSANVSESNLSSSVEVTKAENVTDSDYRLKTTNSKVIPAYDYNMFPGALINTSDDILKGNISYISIDRNGGNFTITPGTKQTKVAIKSGKSAKFSVSTVNQSNIYNKLIETLADRDLEQDIRTSQVTSVEQTAAELGVTVNQIKDFMPDNWDDIRSGKKQVAIALIRQNVCNIDFTDNTNNPSSLFPSDMSVNVVKNKISASNPGMLVKSVEYGTAYLVSAIVNTDTTYCGDKVPNYFADRPDLAGGLANYFQGKSSTLRQKNSLSAAHFAYSYIGGDRTTWSVPQNTTLASIKNILPSKFIANKLATNRLVPLNFKAITLGQRQDDVTWTANAAKYNFSCVSAKKLSSFWVHEHVSGNPTKWEKKEVYGIDLEAFNKNNSIIEKCYCDEDNNDRSRRNESYPAYQCVFGIWAKACPKNNDTTCYSVDRIVQGGYYQGSCYGRNHENNDKVITGPVDLGKGVYCETTDWSEDSYFKVNGVKYGGVKHGEVKVYRLWDRNLNCAGLCNISGNVSSGKGNGTIGTTKISKLKAIKKGFKATVKMQSFSDGYQIRYSTNKNMKKAKTVKINDHLNLTKTVKKLKAKTKYYVQVRTFVLGDKEYGVKDDFSKWSSKKVVKTK